MQVTPQIEGVDAVTIVGLEEEALQRGVQRALQILLGWPSASRTGYGLTPIPQVSMQISTDLDEAEK